MFTCFICKKRSDKSQDLSFHRFPSNSIARQQWLDIIEKSEEVIGKATTICSRHFDTECFCYGLIDGRRFLKPGTKPTINLDISAPINIPNTTEFSPIQTSNIPTNEPTLRSSIEELATSNNKPGTSKPALQLMIWPLESTYGGMEQNTYTGFVSDANDSSDKNKSTVMATQAMVVMVVCLNEHWKIPMGYYFIDSLNEEERARLVSQCLTSLHDIRINVVSLTFDGAQSNVKMAKKLGAEFNFTEKASMHFPHSVIKEPIFVIIDACHAIKLVRNALATRKILYDSEGNAIEWKYFQALVRVQSTEKFCLIMNNCFDLLNSRQKVAKVPSKQCINRDNVAEIRSNIQLYKTFISTLKDGNKPIFESKRRMGFFGIMSALENVAIFDKWSTSETAPLEYLLTYKLSQDHVELFFSAIRSRGGHNNNPTAKQFESAFK
ncbi:THAP domain-containing protein 9 [Temnothorax longispinosus]|uniref:THAP domain-containing protein 9 n=1 Tax=Temnothorax longispinosus TaxID=300112 RepID=A0A4S2K870_9HYME|nr:THAP domain-containing protein 9 [Temnothorax longispinosus]